MLSKFPRNVIVYVLHVNEAKYNKRKKHIVKTMLHHNIPFNWILEGDISDINTAVFKKLFSETVFQSANAITSCCYKHYLAWEKFLISDARYCLILEDDVFLADNFVEMFNRSLVELQNFDDKISIQYSNAANQYTSKAQLEQGKHLYPNIGCRATDAYLITRESAKMRLDYIHKYKFTYPADWQTNIMDNKMGIKFLWFEPTIAEQGTQSGRFKSAIQKESKPLWLLKLKWQIKKFFRRRK